MSTVPPPPEKDHRQLRHTTALVRRAKELVEAGWTSGQTARRLAVEFELPKPPATTTIRRWTEPGYVELHRSWQEKCKRRAQEGPARAPDPFELTDDLLLALRVEDELTYTAISKIAKRFYAVDLDPDHLRLRMNSLGAPKNPNKARATAAQNKRKRAAA